MNLWNVLPFFIPFSNSGHVPYAVYRNKNANASCNWLNIFSDASSFSTLKERQRHLDFTPPSVTLANRWMFDVGINKIRSVCLEDDQEAYFTLSLYLKNWLRKAGFHGTLQKWLRVPHCHARGQCCHLIIWRFTVIFSRTSNRQSTRNTIGSTERLNYKMVFNSFNPLLNKYITILMNN